MPIEPTSTPTKFVSVGGDVDGQTGGGESFRQALGARVVLGQALDVVVERVEHRRSNDPGLAQRAAEEELQPPCLLDRRLGAREHRPQRAAQALGEADGDGVGESGVLGGLEPARNRCVEEARTIEVDGEAELVPGRGDVRQGLERPDPPAGAAVSLLEHDDARRLEPIGGLDGLAHLAGGDPPGVARQAARDQSRMDRRATRLVDQDVRPLLRDQLAPRPRVHAQRDLIRHRRGRKEERGLVTEQLGCAPLELVDGRILALLLVADLGGGHRGKHLPAGPGDRVGAEIDHARSVAGGALLTEPDRTPQPKGWGAVPAALGGDASAVRVSCQ